MAIDEREQEDEFDEEDLDEDDLKGVE